MNHPAEVFVLDGPFPKGGRYPEPRSISKANEKLLLRT